MRFRATNSAGNADASLSITIGFIAVAPTVSAIADVSADYNEAITAITVTTTGDPTPTVTVAGLPSGVTYSSGQISGAPTDIGVHEITVTATNTEGSDSETFDLTVSGEFLFFIDNVADMAFARDLDGNTVTSYNITLGTGAWSGGFGLIDGFYILECQQATDARFWNLNRTRDADRDIDLQS